MSKLTNWLDNDELDIQGIVDKYEKEIFSNSQADNSSNDNESVWSSKLDEEHIKLSTEKIFPKSEENKTIKFDLNESSNKKSNKTIEFTQVDTLNINPSKKPTPPPPPPIYNINKQNLNEVKKTKKLNNTNKNSTILFDKIVDNTNELNKDEDVIKIKSNFDTSVFNNSNSSTKKTKKTNTIVFKNTNDELDKEIKSETKKATTKLNSCKTEKFQPNKTRNLFKNDVESLQKKLRENDISTARISPNETSEITINIEKEKQVENKFADSLTKIFFEETKKSDDLTKEINQASAIDINLEKTTEKKRKGLRSKKSEAKQKYEANVPKFIKTESRFLLAKTIISFIFFLGCIGLIGYIAYLFSHNLQSPYLLIPAGLLTLGSGIYSFINLYHYQHLHKEIKESNYEINKELPLLSLKKIFKRLVIANINLNWFCALVYTLCGLGILLTFIVVYFMNLINYQVNDFGNLILGNDNAPLIAMWTQASICFFLIPVQIVFNVINKRRMNNINMYYQKEIINEELVMQYQKQARKKWKIIYASLVAIVGIVVLVTWLVLRRKAKK